MEKIITIIVTYNGMKWVDSCLSSLRNSSHPTDIVVIDNGSTDETTYYITENYPEVKVIKSKENLGFGKANNLGIKIGLEENYDYFFLLNQDAWVFPNTIGNLVEDFSHNSDFGIISPIQLKKNLEIETIFRSYIKDLESDIKIVQENTSAYETNVKEVDFTNAAVWMISAKCIENVGGFSPLFYHYGEDVDYLHRVKYHKLKHGVSINTFAIHDRNAKPRETVKEYNKRKKHPGPWPLKYYNILADPNFTFFYAVIKSFILFITSLGKHLLKGNFFSVKYDFIVIKEVIRKLNFISNIRKQAKQKTAFIK
ncbi:MAG: glycosyltransferase [Cruoricaptor ignavus]|nr:glycosyltransferase [Cruoricaptor ignavus]